MSLSLKDLTVLGILGILIYVIYLAFVPKPQVTSFPISNTISIEQEIDDEAKEVASIIALGYQVDVEVNSAHVAYHSTSVDAMRCLNNNGNVASFSEFKTRRIHLLCWDEKTQTLFDVIINRINFYVQKFSNPKSQLITAYAPDGVKGASLIEKSTYYLEHLKNTIGGKVVNLKFGPGEIYFLPK